MGATARRRAEQDAAFAGGLLFPQQAGCAGAREGGHPARHPCTARPVGTVRQRREFPRPHTERVFVCEAHAVGHPDPRPLTAADQAELRRRRSRVRG